VLVGSWSEEQEAKILATLDPLAAMAEADAAKLDALLRDVSTGSEALSQMIADLATANGVIPADADAGDTPFAEFGPAVTDDGFVAFKFGDYSGRVGKEVYDSFVETYKQRQQDEAEPMLDDVLRGWLGV
jgi:broad specificity phosphatase PhoE